MPITVIPAGTTTRSRHATGRQVMEEPRHDVPAQEADHHPVIPIQVTHAYRTDPAVQGLIRTTQAIAPPAVTGGRPTGTMEDDACWSSRHRSGRPGNPALRTATPPPVPLTGHHSRRWTRSSTQAARPTTTADKQQQQTASVPSSGARCRPARHHLRGPARHPPDGGRPLPAAAAASLL
jgi:hypothetical protein